MRFTASIYRDASQEHLDTALELHNSGRYVLSHYAAGLAVECLFRAYRYRRDPNFDARHDLLELCKEARFYDIVPMEFKAESEAALVEVSRRWSNNLRFCSEKALRAYLRQTGADRGIKGSVLKESSRRIGNAATRLVLLGESQWNLSNR